MHFDFSLEEINTRGGILDKFMDTAFDAAILVEKGGKIIHNSIGSQKLINMAALEVVGKDINSIDPRSPFNKVLRTGKAEIGLMVVIKSRKCVTNVIPIISNGEIIGVLGMIIFRNLSNLNKILASVNVDNMDGSDHNFYDKIARVDSNYTFDDYIGNSRIIKEMLDQCKRAAETNYPILFIGETGTGKEILANAFHSEHSKERLAPFIKINCTAIPHDLLESELFGHEKGAFTGATKVKKGKFELANSGSILLDEIGDMDLQLQAKLLRVLEEKEYERIGGTKLIPLQARIIVSTNKNLKTLCRQGKFRPDLYYRFSTIEIKVPPLRYRPEDIPLLVKYFIEQNNIDLILSEDCMEVLKQYPWPGNVRELRNVINRLGISDPEKAIQPKDIHHILAENPEETWGSSSEAPSGFLPLDANKALSLGAQEKVNILNSLEKNNHNISKTAKQLNVCRTTLYNKIKKHQIVLNKTSHIV